MSSLPIRARPPVFSPSRAPSRSIALPGFGDGSWAPARIAKSRSGTRILQLAPRLGRVNPGWLIAGVLADLALREASYALTMWLNGLTLHRFCAPLPTDSFQGGSLVCSTGQGRGQPMSNLGPTVAGLSDGAVIRFLGFTNFAGGLAWRGRVTQIYTVNAHAGTAPRPRPYFGPIVAPPAVVGSLAPLYPPGRVPFNVRPVPVWAGARGLPAPSPTPEDALDPRLRPAPGYGHRWTFDGTNNPPKSEPITRPTVTRVTPRPNEHEVKIGANTAAAQTFFAVMRARESLSEFMDFVGVLFDSLPKHTRARYGGAGASDHDKMRAIAENIGALDARQFLKNLIANQIEDEIIGRTWFKGRAKLRNAVFGNRVGSLGPVSNPAFDAYAKAVSNLSKELAAAVMGETGYQHENRLDALMWKAETKLRDLRRSANQSPTPRGQSRP